MCFCYPSPICDDMIKPDKHTAPVYRLVRDAVERGEWLADMLYKDTDTSPTDTLENNGFGISRGAGNGKSVFRFIDLFAGIGGMRLGFESIGGKCVFTSEWDSYAQKTYRANFADEDDADHIFCGDITKIDPSEIPAHDVLLAGFPCQPFSIAGVSKKRAIGQDDGFRCKTQGTLFFDVARIIDEHRPAAFLLENVKNLRSHDKGKTFRVIMETLEDELGYVVDERVIDAKGWVPQHRERIFLAGFRRDVGFSFDDLVVKDPTAGPKLSSVLHDPATEVPEPPYTLNPNARVSDKYSLSEHLWGYLQDYAEKHRKAGNGFGFGLVGSGDTARTLSARYYKDGSEILIKRPRKKTPRRLTPRECARLMGFDDPVSGRKISIPVSDTRAYKQFGNSVVVPVVEAVAGHMLSFIKTAMQDDSEPVLQKLEERTAAYG